MKATLLFRITAIMFLVFTAGHTFGFLSFKPPTPEGMAVRDAMDHVHFQDGGADYSYGGFYRGFGLSATASMLFEAFLAWYLGSMAKRKSPEVRVIGWAFFAWQLPGLILSWMYFGPPPLVLSGLVAALIGVATWMASSQRAKA
jgi:hypothetical protein